MSSFHSRRRPGTVSFARFKLGLSQQQLADILGVSRSLIAMVETGKRRLPRSIANIYNELCNKAATVNPVGDFQVKRGRRPKLSQAGGLPSLVVTNYNNTARPNRRASVAPSLDDKKLRCLCQYTALAFQKRAAEERRQRLSEELSFVSTLLHSHKKLLTILPEGRTRKKYLGTCMHLGIRQRNIEKRLSKYSAVNMLRLELRLGILKVLTDPASISRTTPEKTDLLRAVHSTASTTFQICRAA
jgi:DNA-binding XRE family transcriptional regulator